MKLKYPLLLSASLILLVFSGTISSEKCADISNECRLIAVKCLSPNRIEQKLMEIACPLTCGYCVDERPGRTSSDKNPDKIVPARCFDEADDCEDRTNFCHKKFYKRMMSIQCAKTCKFCDPDDDYEEEKVEVDSREVHLATLKSKMGEEAVEKLENLKIIDHVIDLVRSTNSTTTSEPRRPRKFSRYLGNSFELPDTDECSDKANDCERNQKLCTHKAYSALFRKICARTCEYCTPAEASNDAESSGEFY